MKRDIDLKSKLAKRKLDGAIARPASGFDLWNVTQRM